MSRRNREKRAAKQKIRQRAAAVRGAAPGSGAEPSWTAAPSWTPEPGRTPEPGWADEPDRTAEPAPSQAMIAAALLRAARCRCGGQHAPDLLAEFGGLGRELELAADVVLTAAVRAAWEAGWLPSDLHELARRTLDPTVAGFLLSGIVIESRGYARATVHPRWHMALDGIVAGIGHEVPPAGLMGDWAGRQDRSRVSALATLLQVVDTLATLPWLERLLPLPGAQRHADSTGTEVDRKVLAKVRALLAKAESTEFPDEAEALSAKAQELMSRYSLHQAVHEHDRGQAPEASGRRLWMDAPYPGAKVLLVQAVATANRCRSVWRPDPGFATVIGPETELDIVELLTTSLLLQANRAMLAAGRQTTRGGTSRTRSFRQSFLVAYASRIGERLAAADTTATAAEQSVPRERLLPVLAARSQATDELMDQLFPRMARRPVSVSNSAGWTAGRAAADLARLDVHSSIAG